MRNPVVNLIRGRAGIAAIPGVGAHGGPWERPLLTLFGIARAFSFGIKSALDYSVFSGSTPCLTF
jgi:hypothetical protein